MGAKFIMQEMNDLHNAGKTLLYPKMVMLEACGTDEFSRFISQDTTFNPSEVKGIIERMARGLARMMAGGRAVKLDGIGTFSPSLSLKEGRERESPDGSGARRNAASVEIGGVNFRADKRLVRETNSECRLERRSANASLHVSGHTPEERLEIARKYLEQNAFLTVGMYAELTGLGRTAASLELRRWKQDDAAGIAVQGRGVHKVYVLRRQENNQ